jgi:predicted TIM-barrel fold metal-dependent hydrolase
LSKIKEVKQGILECLSDMKTVDNHEHLGAPFLPEATFEMDLPYFLTHTYLFADLVSSGMPESCLTPEKYKYLEKPCGEDQSEQRWKELKPYLEKVRNTIYYRYLLIALRDLYGLEDEEIDDSNWREISQRIREKSQNHLEWSLAILDKMKVHKVILDINGTSLPNKKIVKDERLVQVVRMDEFIYGYPNVFKNFTDEKVHSFDDYVNMVDIAFKAAKKAGAVGIKSGLAYIRTLFYDNAGRADAEKAFNKGLDKASQDERKAFQDFMMHVVCQKCAEYNLPYQIHTGIQAGNYNTLTNAKPTHLTNLFQKYPDVRFDLFHAGYPYIQEAAIQAKYFPNVYLDGCWLAHISPAAYKRGLDEWLEIVPSNKIFAWGGDHGIIEHSYASLKLARELISEVLATKVVTGYFSEKNALSTAERIVGGNAIEVYGL